MGVVTRAVTGRGAHLLRVSAERFESPVAQMTVQELAELLSNETLVRVWFVVDPKDLMKCSKPGLHDKTARRGEHLFHPGLGEFSTYICHLRKDSYNLQ